MEWFPVIFLTFKALVLAIGMFFAIKWHYERGKKKQGKAKSTREVLRATGKVAAVLLLLVLVVGLVAYVLISALNLDLAIR